MKEWEKELNIYRLTLAPPKKNLQEYISLYISEKDDQYLSWFLHYYERTLNEKAMEIVQDYAMYGHFIDIKQAYVVGMLKSIKGLRHIPWNAVCCIQRVRRYARGTPIHTNHAYRFHSAK